MPDKVSLQNGDVFLVMVRDGKVFHYSRNMSLPHVDFVRRKTGGGPEGAWVGTVSKLDDEIVGITSKYFYDYQMPAPPEVNQALQAFFGTALPAGHVRRPNAPKRRFAWLPFRSW